MSVLNIAAYASGCIYPTTSPIQPVSTTISQLKQSGFTTAILGLFHIGRDYKISPTQIMGDLYFNDTLVISKGVYVGDSSWPGLVESMIGGTVTQLCASIGGGGGVMDFQTIMKIYQHNGNSFSATNLMENLKCLRKTFPSISIMDMDCEDEYDSASFLAFNQMLIDIGFGITFCPYTSMSFWTDSLKALNTSNPGAVKWWNLQCYSGGSGNNPSNWASAITQAIPGFPTAGYILASDWSRYLVYNNGVPQYWGGDCPSGVQQLMGQFKGQTCVGGGFIWMLDYIVAYQYNSGEMKDPQDCDNAAKMTAYVNAMTAGLGY